MDRQRFRGAVRRDRHERGVAAADDRAYAPARISPPWSEQPNVSHVPLEPLSTGETARIVEARFGGDNLPEELRRLVAAKAEGNALFAEELVSFLLERGFVRRQSAGIVFDAVTVASALPASVQSLLTARVDRLAFADRALLQAAAVIGRRFDPRSARQLQPAPAAISTDRSPLCKRSILSIAKARPATTYSSTPSCAMRSIAACSTPLDQCCTSKSPTRSSGAAPIVFPKSLRHSRTTTRPLAQRQGFPLPGDGRQEMPGYPFSGRGGCLCPAGVGPAQIKSDLRQRSGRR